MQVNAIASGGMEQEKVKQTIDGWIKASGVQEEKKKVRRKKRKDPAEVFGKLQSLMKGG